MKKIILHIPKTAGTTIRMILEDDEKVKLLSVYPGEKHYTQLSDIKKMDLKDYDIIYGHINFGIHNLAKIDDFKYIAFLRNPVDRIISYYNHVMYNDPNFKNKPISLIKFLNRPDKQVYNHQVRVISGIDFDKFHCNDKIFEKAVENLKKYFLMVGITEEFDKSLILLYYFLNKETPGYVKENVSTKKIFTKESLSIYEIDKIRLLNTYDLALYQEAKRLLNQKINELNINIKEELQKLKEKKEYIQKIKKPKVIWS